jgi:hypothetical protein
MADRGQNAIVFIFPQPEDNLKFPAIVAKAKEIFAAEVNLSDIRIHALRGKAADTVGEFLITGEEPKSNLVDHARRELELIGEDPEVVDWYVSVIRAFTGFGHSGGSASVMIPTLNDLLQFKNLSALTDDPDEWNHISDAVAGHEDLWQSRRNPEAFSHNGGKSFYYVSDKLQEMHFSEKKD